MYISNKYYISKYLENKRLIVYNHLNVIGTYDLPSSNTYLYHYLSVDIESFCNFSEPINQIYNVLSIY